MMDTEQQEVNPVPKPAKTICQQFRPGRIVLFLLVAAAGLAVDLGTKHIVFDRVGFPNYREEKISWVFENLLGFQTSLNEGALWGMGAGQVRFFVAASFAALIGVGLWFWLEGSRTRLMTISLALLTAGILGNLWDRLALHGLIWPAEFGSGLAGKPIYAVRDWILILIGSYRWPNFNIADSCLVCGTIFITIRILFKKEKGV